MNKTVNGVTQAAEFLMGFRGRIILAQALKIAIVEMSKVKLPHREVSNIEDMKFLLENWGIDIEEG